MDTMAGPSPRRLIGVGVTLCAAFMLAGCQSSSTTSTAELAPLDESPIFSSSEYGVPASPRMTSLKAVPKGGGRDQIGKPYKVRGNWYYPKDEPGYVADGKASWYGSNFHGRLTANGEIYDMYHLSAAHPTFPLPSYARVTNQSNGHSVMVRVNDRGPYAHGRVVDVSQRAAEVLGFQNAGIADVTVEYLGRAPLEGDDSPTLMASFRPGGSRPVDDGLPSGVMIASNTAPPQTRQARQAPINAISYNGASPMPSVRPLAASVAIESGLQMPAMQAAPSSVPLPTLREAVLSYAPAAAPSGAFGALASLAAGGAPTPERVEIGIVEDIDLLLRIHATIEGRGTLVEERVDGGQSLALAVDPSQDTDTVLRALWAAGAEDAFVLRD